MKLSTVFLVFGVLMALLVGEVTHSSLLRVENLLAEKDATYISPDSDLSLSNYPGDNSLFDISFAGADAAEDNSARGPGKFRCPTSPNDTTGMLQLLAEYFQKKPKTISDQSDIF